MARLNRRLLIANAQKQGGYVTDGLILHLDGIDYGNQSGKWIDLVDGVEFSVSGDVVKGDNSFVFTNGYISAPVSLTNKIVTVEAVIKPASNDYMLLLMNSSFDKTIAFNRNCKIQFNGNQSAAKCVSVPINKISSLSSDYSSVFLNGEAVNQFLSTESWNTADSQTLIGRYRTAHYAYIGNIYSLRIYDRLLTAQEIARNFAVDKARFSIT